MTPSEIVHLMLKNDAFTKELGMQLLTIKEGFCQLKVKVNPAMVNGFNIAHGGITYSLSDSAMAFAANAYGEKCVSIETAISHLRPAKLHDELTATCEELNRGKTLAIYQVKITNQMDKKIALFKGTVFISNEKWGDEK